MEIFYFLLKNKNYSAVESGVIQLKIPFDDNLTISFEAFNLAGGQYKKLFGRPMGTGCQVIYENHLENATRKWFSQTNLTITYGTCPILPQYTL